MKSRELLQDGYDRIAERVAAVVDGLNDDQLTTGPAGATNTIAWLVWHLTRVQDDHIADAAGSEQVWIADGWFERFALHLEASATGYGHDPEEVAAVRASADLLRRYHAAVHERTRRFLTGVDDADLDRVIDDGWDPPVTLGVRLISVLSDDLQHVGQAAYVRGILLNV